MKIVLPLVVAVVLLLGVTYFRYGQVYSQMSRDLVDVGRSCASAAPASSYDGGGIGTYRDPAVEECERRAQAQYHAGDTRRYIIGAWLWGAIAGLLGGLLTFMFAARRSKRPSGEASASA